MDNIQAAVDAGAAMADADQHWTDIGGIPVAIVPGAYTTRVMAEVLAAQDARAAAPRRLRGTSTHLEMASFIEHVNRFKDAASVIYADPSKGTLTAIYDHPAGSGMPAWAEHRAIYACPTSEQWRTWTGHAGVPMAQDPFGAWIDDHMEDIVSADGYPPAAAVLEMARSLVIHSHGTFERRINPTTGESICVCKDEHEASSTKIHRAFMLGIPVFIGGQSYALEARIRFTMRDGKPQFSYDLPRASAVLADAFNQIRAHVTEKTGLPLYVGTPES